MKAKRNLSSAQEPLNPPRKRVGVGKVEIGGKLNVFFLAKAFFIGKIFPSMGNTTTIANLLSQVSLRNEAQSATISVNGKQCTVTAVPISGDSRPIGASIFVTSLDSRSCKVMDVDFSSDSGEVEQRIAESFETDDLETDEADDLETDEADDLETSEADDLETDEAAGFKMSRKMSRKISEAVVRALDEDDEKKGPVGDALNSVPAVTTAASSAQTICAGGIEIPSQDLHTEGPIDAVTGAGAGLGLGLGELTLRVVEGFVLDRAMSHKEGSVQISQNQRNNIVNNLASANFEGAKDVKRANDLALQILEKPNKMESFSYKDKSGKTLTLGKKESLKRLEQGLKALESLMNDQSLTPEQKAELNLVKQDMGKAVGVISHNLLKARLKKGMRCGAATLSVVTTILQSLTTCGMSLAPMLLDKGVKVLGTVIDGAILEAKNKSASGTVIHQELGEDGKTILDGTQEELADRGIEAHQLGILRSYNSLALDVLKNPGLRKGFRAGVDGKPLGKKEAKKQLGKVLSQFDHLIAGKSPQGEADVNSIRQDLQSAVDVLAQKLSKAHKLKVAKVASATIALVAAVAIGVATFGAGVVTIGAVLALLNAGAKCLSAGLGATGVLWEKAPERPTEDSSPLQP
ncbi:MAG: hypothetical protein LBJ94_01780 [Puniceicoccales bacterium]|nr:hypothetical protein [Puniceicoccales bacterium]